MTSMMADEAAILVESSVEVKLKSWIVSDMSPVVLVRPVANAMYAGLTARS